MDPETVLRHVDRAEYPWTPKRMAVDQDGHEMAYLDEGKGKPVLFVHGNPTWSYEWRHLIKGLQKKHRCIAPDHIGFGCSDKPREPSYYDLERHIRNLSTLVRELDLKKVTVVVHDWGGPIGLGWAVRAMERVARVVILNTWAMRPDDLLELPWWYRMSRGPGVGEILYLKHNVLVEKGIPRLIHDKSKVTPALMDAYRAPFPFPDDRTGILRFTRMVPTRMGDESYEILGSIEAELPKLDVPVDIFWGRKDPAFGKKIAHRFCELLPQADAADIVDLHDASHYVTEDAGEVILEHLKKSLKR